MGDGDHGNNHLWLWIPGSPLSRRPGMTRTNAPSRRRHDERTNAHSPRPGMTAAGLSVTLDRVRVSTDSPDGPSADVILVPHRAQGGKKLDKIACAQKPISPAGSS